MIILWVNIIGFLSITGLVYKWLVGEDRSNIRYMAGLLAIGCGLMWFVVVFIYLMDRLLIRRR